MSIPSVTSVGLYFVIVHFLVISICASHRLVICPFKTYPSQYDCANVTIKFLLGGWFYFTLGGMSATKTLSLPCFLLLITCNF